MSSQTPSAAHAALARGSRYLQRCLGLARTGYPTSIEGISRRVLSPRTGVYVLAALAFVFILAGTKSWASVADMYNDRFAGHSARGPHEDYVVYYTAGRLVREGHGDALYDVRTLAHEEVESVGRSVGGTGVLAYFNPPFVAAAFAPLSALPIEVATVIIGIVTTALALAAGLGIQRLLGLEDWLQRLLLWLGFLSLYSVSWVVLHGQLSMVLLLGWLLFIVLQMRGRESLSGAALALLLVKPQMAILPVVLLLWKRRWRPLASFAAVAWALAMVSIAVSGPSVVIDYPRFLLESAGWENKWGVTPEGMFGWNGFAARLLDNNSAGHLTLTWTLSGITLLAALAAFQGDWAPRKPRFLLQCGALLMASLLVNPHLYMQDLSLMALALALALAYALRTNQGVLPWAALALSVWLVQLWGLRILDHAGVNLLTPVMAVTLGALLLAQRGREPVEATAPREAPEVGIRVLYLLQGAYLAFIVSLSIARNTFLMPDVILLLLVAGFVWGKQRLHFVRDFAPFVLLLLSYDAMRGMADDLTGRVYVDYPIALERALFLGHVPTQELQRWFSDPGVTHWYDSLAALLHAVHFVVPLLFAALIWQHRREQYWRFVIALLLLSYAGFVTYMLLPTAPPWWAAGSGDPEGVRLVHLSGHMAFIYDKVSPNAVAAMPSLHAAYPWLFYLFARRLWGRRARPVILYPAAVFLSSVYLGHHYVVDIIGGVYYASVSYYLVCGPVGEYLARNRRLFGSPRGAPVIRGSEAPLRGEPLLPGVSHVTAKEGANRKGKEGQQEEARQRPAGSPQPSG